MVPPKGVYYLPISKLHSILAVANLLAPNKITICYYAQINSLELKSSVASKTFGGTIYFAADGTFPRFWKQMDL